MARIRGFGIRGLLRFVKHRTGDDDPGGLQRLLSELPAGDRAIFQEPIRHVGWYPYDLYSRLLELVDHRLGDGNLSLMEELGRFAAHQEGQTPFEFISTDHATVETLLGSSTYLWERYCDAGAFSARILGPGEGIATLSGFPEISPCHCRLLAGWIGGMGRAAGAKSGRVTKTRCVHRGDEVCEYHGEWTI